MTLRIYYGILIETIMIPIILLCIIGLIIGDRIINSPEVLFVIPIWLIIAFLIARQTKEEYY